jgi:hypothetical protein
MTTTIEGQNFLAGSLRLHYELTEVEISEITHEVIEWLTTSCEDACRVVMNCTGQLARLAVEVRLDRDPIKWGTICVCDAHAEWLNDHYSWAAKFRLDRVNDVITLRPTDLTLTMLDES